MVEDNTNNAGGSDHESSEEEFQVRGDDFYNNRFYRARLPEKGTVVKVETIDVRDIFANVRLLEYGGIEGIIQMSQVTAKRVRSIQKHLKVGRREMMEVLRVDEQKMYIDLGKKSIIA